MMIKNALMQAGEENQSMQPTTNNQLEMKEEEKKESKIHTKEDFVKEAKMQAKRLRELIHCQPETHHRSSSQTS